MEEWQLTSNQVCAVLGLRRVPNYSTLSRTFRKMTQADWEQLRDRFLCQLDVDEEAIAAVSTSFRLNQASLYYYNRVGKVFGDWINVGFIQPSYRLATEQVEI